MSVPPVLEAEISQHSQLLGRIILCILGTSFLAMLAPLALDASSWDEATYISAVILLAFLLLAWLYNKKGRYILATVVVVTVLSAMVLYTPLTLKGGFDTWPLFYLVLPVLIAAMFLSVRLVALFVALNTVFLALLGMRADVELYTLPILFFLCISAVCVILLHHLNALQRIRQKALEESRERFRQLTETVFEAIVVEEEGIIREANPGFEQMFGCPAADTASVALRRFLPDWDRMLALAESGGAAEAFRETTGKRADGARVFLQYAIRRLRDGRHVLALRDVTHERQLEMQYHQAQKMEAVGHLAGGVAHDFNNLLQAIMGYTDMAMSEISPGHPARELLERVGLASTRAAGLIHQLLSFSRREAMDHGTVNFAQIVPELTSMLERLLGEHVALKTEMPKNLWHIRGDAGQLTQVLMNLCVNARDAMPAGGTITITAANNAGLDSAIRPRWTGYQEGGFVHISVRDTGVGMEPDVLEHVFEPFFTTKELGRGTGLGLATVYGIIKQHRGHVEVESVPGAGTTFHLYFPASFEAEKAAPSRAAMPPRGGTERILVAEDEESVRSMVVTALEKAGYRVRVARDGAEAVELFEANPGGIDLALLDVMMPRKSGRDAAEAMKKLRPALPVLYSTGHDFNLLGAGFRPDEKSAILRKPYTAAELLRQIRLMLDVPLSAP